MAQSSAPEDSPLSEPEDQTLPDAPPANLLEEAADTNGAKGAEEQTNDGAEDANKMSLDGMFDDEEEDDEFTTSSNMSRGLDTGLTEPAKLASKLDVKLEDLFKDEEDEEDEEDEDDEFFSGPRAVEKVEESSPPPSSPPLASLQLAPSAAHSDPEVMLQFYQRLFPFRFLFQWLNHAIKPTNDFCHREFAFTLHNDAYLRYQSFKTGDLLRKDVLRVNPCRFEIGPIYTANPRDRKTLRKSTAFRPMAKELVFDIDLTDYDEIRTCCSKANICQKCWPFITMAIKVVDAALRQDFGFRHIIWVYSGRRGAHAWISDKRVREMDDSKRRAIAGYLEVIKGGAQSGKKVNLRRPLHPHIARSLEILKVHFSTDILQAQDPFRTPSQSDRLLALLPDKPLADALRKKWSTTPDRSSMLKWADIDQLAKSGVSKTLEPTALRDAKQDIVLEYTYPRLDAEVSKKTIHLLKSPFVVHPSTGRVCVPIDTSHLDEFNPEEVPTVTQLLAEIDGWEKPGLVVKHEEDQEELEGGESGGDTKMEEPEEKDLKVKVPDYVKTGLKPYIDYFKSYVTALLRDERGVKREKEEGVGDVRILLSGSNFSFIRKNFFFFFFIMLSLHRLAVRAIAVPFSSTIIPARSSRSITSLISIASRSAAAKQPSRLLPSLSQRRYEHGATQYEPEETSPAAPAEPEAPKRDMLRESLPPSTTLYVGNLFFDVAESDVQREFEKAGEVVSIRIIKDGRGLSKGFGYVEFKDQATADRALEMFHLQLFEGRRMNVAYTSRPRSEIKPWTPHRNPPSRTLFLGNVAFDATDRDLNQLVAQFPKCTDVRIAIDRRTGQSRGFAHIEFLDVESAVEAHQALNGASLYGRELRVDYGQPANSKRDGAGPGGRRGDSEPGRERY